MRTGYELDWSTEYANKLANLARLINQHPEFEWSSYSLGMIHAGDAEEMANVAKTLGGKWNKKSDQWTYELHQEPSDDNHYPLVISASHRAICEKVGEEVVETETEIPEKYRTAIEAGETTVTTTTTKAIWKCPESILALASNDDES